MASPELVEAMQQPKFYPHGPRKVELIQTHISYVFIAGKYVYKVKKELNLGFLDFTTLEKRQYYCQQELELNRRLAPDIYLEVVAIFSDQEGRFLLGTGSEIVEYAVKMKKLPENRMLKRLLAAGKIDLAFMSRLAQKIAAFHGEAATGGKIDLMGCPETIRRNHEENFLQAAPFINVTIPFYKFDFIKAYSFNFIEKNMALFKKRIATGRIRDCHGDLHLEHICLLNKVIVVYDCIEFNERFRYEDVAAEVAFLAMDLDDNGYFQHAEAFVKAYTINSGDGDIAPLLNFYKCYYAYVRGKVMSFELNDRDISEKEHQSALTSAGHYFDLAYNYASRLDRPTLIIMSGLMGTGKSVLANSLASLLGADVISSDLTRKELFRVEPTARHYEDFGQGIYRNDLSLEVYDKLREIAVARIKAGKSVIIDASFKKRGERMAAFATAQLLAVDFFVLECTCPEKIIRNRLARRQADDAEISDGRWEIFAAQQADFDTISEFPAPIHLTLDTSLDRELCLDKTIRHVKNLAAAKK